MKTLYCYYDLNVESFYFATKKEAIAQAKRYGGEVEAHKIKIDKKTLLGLVNGIGGYVSGSTPIGTWAAPVVEN